MIIDVSYHNGVLDWEKLKPQIEGAILRCGYGSDLRQQDDKQWARNAAECERLGIPYGVYLYSYAANAAAAMSEAAHVKRLLNGHNPTLPVFFDAEEQGLGKFSRKTFETFRDALKGKYRIGLYTGEAYYNAYLAGGEADYLWIAKYGKNDGTPHQKPSLKGDPKIALWQYSSNGMGGSMDVSVVLDNSIFARSESYPYWVRYGDNWYYRIGPGQNQHGWRVINHHWFYFNEIGRMETDWFKVGDEWFYSEPSGELEGALYHTDSRGAQSIWYVD